MPNTYTQLYIQVVFAVKGRESFIKPYYREKIQKFITGIVTNRNQKLYQIFIMPDHTHILIGINPDMTISDLVRDIKAGSSKFINDNNLVKGKFNWQTGYGAFSYSRSHVDAVVKYIQNQEEHHKRKSFKEEYIDFLEKFEIEYHEKYLFEWVE